VDVELGLGQLGSLCFLFGHLRHMIVHMFKIADAVVRGGQLVLSGLPFAEGQHVEVVVAEVHPTQDQQPQIKPLSIAEVRAALRGGVERFDDPFEPAIPPDQWEMLK
jgi:hypothetical protein